MVGSFCIASRCLLRRCTCIDRPIGPTSGVARTLPRDRQTLFSLRRLQRCLCRSSVPSAAAPLPLFGNALMTFTSILDTHIPPYSSLSMSLIRLFYSFCPFLGLKCGHPLCMCACSPVALFLFHSLPRSSAKCSCMLHYCSSVSRPP